MLLVTTAEEESWDSSENTLFLGEWCRHYTKKSKWEKIDYVVCPPYGLDHDIKSKDLLLITATYKDILKDISIVMNRLHNEEHSIRYWEIVIGPWLYQFIKMLLGRYRALSFAVDKYNITKTIILDINEDKLITKDHISFNKKYHDDEYNHLLYSVLLCKYFSANMSFIHKAYKSKVRRSGGKKKQGIVHSSKQYIRKIFVLMNSMYSKFRGINDAVIFRSYLSRFSELKLQIRLKQLPVYYVLPVVELEDVADFSSRNEIVMPSSKSTGFDKIVREMLFKVMPSVYIENYHLLIKQTVHLPFPAKPKFIFTSNSFSFDEPFKFWTAKKVEQGVKYYVGQHGSNYGTLKYTDVWPEINTCSKFVSWGWDNVYEKPTLRGFNFKVAGTVQTYNKNGGLILVERWDGHRTGPQDCTYEHILYQKNVFKFYDGLNSNIGKQVTVRLHHGVPWLDSSDKYLWNTKWPDVPIDEGLLPLSGLITKNRLVVFSYECAGFLECMALNIPTICFWRGGLDHLFDDAADYYRMLKSVGLMTNDAEKAASYVNMHWEDLDVWWNSKDVQDARIKFCDRYSRVVKNPTKMLANMLLEDSKN